MSEKLKPTPGESLLLWRRRKGMNQVDAAAHFEIPLEHLRAIEAGRGLRAPRIHLGTLRPYEVCYLLRRRVTPELTQRALAQRLGLTRLWVIQMEGGVAPCDRLVKYWKL